MSDSSLAATARRLGPTGYVAPGRTASERFKDYVRTRKYDFGRGTASAWTFIAFARGDPAFPDVRSWRELHAYLVRSEVDEALIEAGRTTWRSFKALQSRTRRKRIG